MKNFPETNNINLVSSGKKTISLLKQKENQTPPLRQSFKEMSYAELREAFAECSPHLIPILSKMNGCINRAKIICEKHQFAQLLIDGEVQPCYQCLVENQDRHNIAENRSWLDQDKECV